MDSVTRWSLQDRAGGMPSHAFLRLVETGLLPQPGSDGRWPASVTERLDAVLELGGRVRSLERRVLLLHTVGFHPDVEHRRAAAIDVVRRIRPAARKMKQVRMALDVLAARASLGNPVPPRPRTYALPLAHEHWETVLRMAGEELWQREWELAARYAQILPAILRAANVRPLVDLPEEEWIVLALIDQLLRHEVVRQHVPLSPPVNRFRGART